MLFSDEENFKNYILIMLIYFPSGRYVDDVANIQTNYQCTSVIVIHFMKGAVVALLNPTELCRSV